MPSLASLDLRNIRLPWSSPLLKSTLTRLTLATDGFKDKRDPSSPWTTVLRVMNNLPLLEYLNLHSVLPDTEPDPFLALPHPVPLPRLQTLMLGDSTSLAACLLQSIKYPTSAHIRIVCTESDQDTFDRLSVVLAAKADDSPECPAPRLSAVYCTEREVSAWAGDPGIEVLDSFLNRSDPASHRAPGPLLALMTLSSFGSRHTLLPCVEALLPPTTITALYFEPHVMTPGTEALRMLSAEWERMSNVRILGVNERGCASTLKILDGSYRTGDGGDGGGPHQQCPLPVLEALMLYGVWIHGSPSAKETTGYTLAVLRHTLAQRKADGHQVKRLVIIQCVNIGPEDVASLKGLAEEVEWDGKETWIERLTRNH